MFGNVEGSHAGSVHARPNLEDAAAWRVDDDEERELPRRPGRLRAATRRRRSVIVSANEADLGVAVALPHAQDRARVEVDEADAAERVGERRQATLAGRQHDLGSATERVGNARVCVERCAVLDLLLYLHRSNVVVIEWR